MMFHNLIPAFDAVPMRRVFPICLYTAEQWEEAGKLEAALAKVIGVSGCGVIQQYPFLEGSGLYRASLQKPNHETYEEFAISQQQLAADLVRTLRESNFTVLGDVNINIAVPGTDPKNESKDWAGRVKDLTEAVKNMLLITASCIFLFDGTLIKSSETAAEERHQVTIMQMDRKVELQALPKILEATKPEEIHEMIDTLPSNSPNKSKKPPMQQPKGRKFR
jgi:hypothetical protein